MICPPCRFAADYGLPLHCKDQVRGCPCQHREPVNVAQVVRNVQDAQGNVELIDGRIVRVQDVHLP